MAELECPNTKCNYSWNYKGKAIYYTSCPMCLWRVKIHRTKAEANEMEELIKQIEELERKGDSL